jgi:hypothetical protein
MPLPHLERSNLRCPHPQTLLAPAHAPWGGASPVPDSSLDTSTACSGPAGRPARNGAPDPLSGPGAARWPRGECIALLCKKYTCTRKQGSHPGGGKRGLLQEKKSPLRQAGHGPLPVPGPRAVPVPCTECRTCVSRIIIRSLFVLTTSNYDRNPRNLPRRSELSLFLLSIH